MWLTLKSACVLHTSVQGVCLHRSTQECLHLLGELLTVPMGSGSLFGVDSVCSVALTSVIL